MSRISRALPSLPAHPDVLAFVVPRYGAEVVGGAETLCRLVAEDLASSGESVEVLTTCAVDHFSWADHHAPGTTEEEGVLVHRFPVGPRDAVLHAELHHQIDQRVRVPYIDELRWSASSVRSPELETHLLSRDDLRAVFAVPYLFGTTHAALLSRPDITLLIPCLHDEPQAHTRLVRDMLASAVGCLANAPGEAELIAEVAPAATVRIGGVGFEDPPSPPDAQAFCQARGIAPGYLLYAGRREEGKGVGELFEDYRRFRQRFPDAPSLALMGSGQLDPPEEIVPHVIELGFVAEEEKLSAFAGASVFLHPSRMESFGMVLLEAWLAGTPALVHGGSRVLKDHARSSGGGLWYQGRAEFQELLSRLLEDEPLRQEMARRGQRYVREQHSWDAVRTRYLEAVEQWL